MASREEGTKRLVSLLFLLLWTFSGTEGEFLQEGHKHRHSHSNITVNDDDSIVQTFSKERTSTINDINDRYLKLNSHSQYVLPISSSGNNFVTHIRKVSKVEELKVPIKTSVIINPVSKTLSANRFKGTTASSRSNVLETRRTVLPFSSKKRRVKRIVSQNLIRDKSRSLPTTRSTPKGEVIGRKGRNSRNPDIDGIIHGIMKLLGGNVKLKGNENPDTKLTTYGGNPSRLVTSTRINNRGPPRLPQLPFGMLPPGVTRPPIRLPITPPSGSDAHIGPAFVANTRPPFLVPLPPGLTSRPSETKLMTGIPIPEDLLTHINPSTDKVDSAEVNPSFETTDDDDFTTSSSLDEIDSKKKVNEQKPTTSVNEPTEPTPMVSESEIDSGSSSSLIPSTSILTSSMSSDDVLSSSGSATETLESISTTIQTSNIPISKTVQSSTPSTEIQYTSTEAPSKTKESMGTFMTTTTSVDLISDQLATQLHPSPSSSFSELPTRLPDPIRPFKTTGHPGLVLEDTVDTNQQLPFAQVITAPAYGTNFDSRPQIFDVTVSALQGYGAAPPTKYIGLGGVGSALITSASKAADGSVFIDGRKTYFDLLPATGGAQKSQTSSSQVPTLGIGTVFPEPPSKIPGATHPGNYQSFKNIPPPKQQNGKPPRPPPSAKPKPASLEPPRRIDTCIVGYDNTCNTDLGEMCLTEGDVSSCFCRPGTARRRPRTKCKKSILLHLSLKVDRVGDRRIVWGVNYGNPEAREYQVLQFEAQKALQSALSQSQAMSQLYLDSSVNKFYSLGGRVIVNSTVKLLHTPQTASSNIKRSLQRHLIRVIQANSNYIGNSVLSVEGKLNPIPDVSDVNECFDPSLYDCNSHASCTNVFGSFDCNCNNGFTDRYPDDPAMSGRFCDSCSKDFCNKKGECRINDGVNVCVCDQSYYGTRCEIDGEVVAVAVIASVAAVVIIVLTLIFLCMWSRKWKAQDRKTQFLTGRPGFFGAWRNRGGRDGIAVHNKGGSNPYGVSMEDRIRWAQLAEQMAQQNIYASPLEAEAAAAAVMANMAITHLGTPPERPKDNEWTERVVGDLKRIFSKLSFKSRAPPPVEGHFTPEETQTLRQMINLQTRLAAAATSTATSANQPEQMRPPVGYYQEQMKKMPPPNEYATIGTLNGLPQHFGMHHMNPQFNYASKPPSTYGQFGPMNNASSIGGISRAPTLGARTPLPMRDLLGGPATLGPLGGGAVSHNYAHHDNTESSEDDPEQRPYHMPRPKSRGSALDSNDIYFEPDDMMTSRYPPPLPSSPPPAVPFTFDHFFKTRFQ